MKYIFLMVLAVVVAGCVSQTWTTLSNVPSISIISPADGQNIQGTTTIKVDLSSNIKLVPAGGEMKEGEGHFHVYLDGGNEQRGVKTSFEYTGVTLGVHTIRAELHKSDHSLYEGAVKFVTVTLGGSPATIAAKQFDVVAKQWSFEPGTIEVNQGDAVILKIKSADVEHGIAIPDFGVSKKIEPGKETTVQFIADKKGTFTFFCNVQCGSGHKDMKGTLVVK